MSKAKNELYAQYPWLSIQTTVEEYVDPDYYNGILRDYIFEDKTDLNWFVEWLKPISEKTGLKVLELGCGTGRVTECLINAMSSRLSELSLLDLSNQMIEFCCEKFRDYNYIRFIRSDSIEFLNQTAQVYDVIYSLWSFSHSVHQILIRDGLEVGKLYVQSGLRKIISENMASGSKFFLIHFDSRSDEQKILLQQWKKVFPVYSNTDVQSPSKLVIDEELARLEKEGLIEVDIKHYVGREIEYSSENDALEVFLNFHMESFFNDSDLLPEIIEELKTYFKGFTDDSGVVIIKPGCFIYEVRKR